METITTVLVAHWSFLIGPNSEKNRNWFKIKIMQHPVWYPYQRKTHTFGPLRIKAWLSRFCRPLLLPGHRRPLSTLLEWAHTPTLPYCLRTRKDNPRYTTNVSAIGVTHELKRRLLCQRVSLARFIGHQLTDETMHDAYFQAFLTAPKVRTWTKSNSTEESYIMRGWLKECTRTCATHFFRAEWPMAQACINTYQKGFLLLTQMALVPPLLENFSPRPYHIVDISDPNSAYCDYKLRLELTAESPNETNGTCRSNKEAFLGHERALLYDSATISSKFNWICRVSMTYRAT